MTITTYDQWITDTKQGTFTPRSKALEKIDAAIKLYTKSKTAIDKADIKIQLDAWIKIKGVTWKTSVRNKTKAVEKLFDEFKAAPYVVQHVKWAPPPLPVIPVRGEVYLGASFQFANSQARHQVPAAIARAQKLIDSAYRGIHQAKSPGEDRDIFETWFGAYDAARFQTVRANVVDVYDALHKGVLLYFRGVGATGPTDCAAENGAIKAESFFGAAWKAKDTPKKLNGAYTHIFLGSEFFSSGAYAQDSAAGVIIHELTHAICNTDDVNYKGVDTYGAVLCKRLANEQPPLAVTNANCYEYLCENYQNKNYIPPVVALNLPVKKSVNLTF